MGELTWEFKEYLIIGPIKSAVESHDKWREEFEMRNNQPAVKYDGRVRIMSRYKKDDPVSQDHVGKEATVIHSELDDENEIFVRLDDGTLTWAKTWAIVGDTAPPQEEATPWVKVDDNTYRKPGTAWVAVYDGGDSYQPWRMTHDDFPASEWAMTYHMRGHKPKNLRTALAKLEEFLAQHKPPRPALPNEGDYIRVTYEAGSTNPHQGTVVRVKPYGEEGTVARFYLDSDKNQALFVVDRVKEQDFGVFQNDVTWEPAEKPEKEWAFGDIVTSGDKPTGEFRAVDKDGSLWFDTGAMYTQYAPYKLVWLADKEI